MRRRSPTLKRKALIIIDLQFCFLPKGSLATTDDSDPDASQLIAGIAEQARSGDYTSIYITKDTHTQGHASFADASTKPFEVKPGFYEDTRRKWNKSRDQVMWTPHCVCDTRGRAVDGSDYHPNGRLGCDVPFDIREIVPPDTNIGYVAKGFSPLVDSYSAIADAQGDPTPLLVRMNDDEPTNRTFLAHLNQRRYDVIDICGIARDKCVLWTAFDLLEYLDDSPTIRFLYSLTRPVVAGLYAANLDITAKDIESIVSTEFPTKAETFRVVKTQSFQGGHRRTLSPRRAQYKQKCDRVVRGGGVSKGPVTENEYQKMVDDAITKNGHRQPDNGMESISIGIDRRNLFDLKAKSLHWLQSHATQPSELNTFFLKNPTWGLLVKDLLNFDLV